MLAPILLSSIVVGRETSSSLKLKVKILWAAPFSGCASADSSTSGYIRNTIQVRVPLKYFKHISTFIFS